MSIDEQWTELVAEAVADYAPTNDMTVDAIAWLKEHGHWELALAIHRQGDDETAMRLLKAPMKEYYGSLRG